MKWNNYIYIGLLLQLVFAASCYDEKDSGTFGGCFQLFGSPGNA